MSFRTDRHNNPAAITTDIAKQAGLVLGKDYEQGEPFTAKVPGVVDTVHMATYYTARLLGDCITLTIHVIDSIGYYTKFGTPRWTYMSIPASLWKMFTHEQKVQAVFEHYKHEGGTELTHLFSPPIVSLNLTVHEDINKMDAQVENG